MILNLFTSTIYKGKIKNSSYKNHFLNILKKDKKINNKNIKNSNLGGFHSTSFIGNEPILENIIRDHLQEYINNFSIKKTFSVKISNWWMIENKTSDSNIMHNHPLSNISGAIYLRVPENSGRIFFYNDNQHIHSYGLRDFFNDSCFHCVFPLKVEVNDILLFPSYLLHSVEANKSNESRIVLSFNLNLN
jgi:uncharacterized protein (TIGR02466 family)